MTIPTTTILESLMLWAALFVISSPVLAALMCSSQLSRSEEQLTLDAFTLEDETTPVTTI